MIKKSIIRGRQRCTNETHVLTLLLGCFHNVLDVRGSCSTAAHSGQFLYRWCGFLRIPSVDMVHMYPVLTANMIGTTISVVQCQ